MASNFKHTAETLRREIEIHLHRVGILCRVFGRGKDAFSLESKISKSPGKYVRGGKLIQDAIGIRVALYFAEDVPIVAHLLSQKYVNDVPSSTIDLPQNDQFSVSRHNLIYRLPESLFDEMRRSIGKAPIDLAFEVQLRSILSEGWHEVEHDLRYKSPTTWDGHDDLSRALNGIIATIETAEWSMRKIFDDLAYRNYKQRKWPEMLQNRLRMRTESNLSTTMCALFHSDLEIAKSIFRLEKVRIIDFLIHLRPSIPLSLDNIVYAWNFLGPRHQSILDLTPTLIADSFESQLPATRVLPNMRSVERK